MAVNNLITVSSEYLYESRPFLIERKPYNKVFRYVLYNRLDSVERWEPGSTNASFTVTGGDAYSQYEAIYKKKSCVAEGTLITLADGSQKAVETLTGDEMLLVWNLYTGEFDVAPILFVDHDPAKEYKVINLYFSDGTSVKVIDEHAFWDFNLNRYVFLREDAAQYMGHWYNKQINDANGELAWTKVQLVNVVVQYEFTTSWSPVTYAHLCFYVNGMLSMPGNTEKLINIFEVNAETMQIDEEAFLADIETYGIFTYEEFAEVIPVSEIVFEAFSMQYYKVAIGKGLLDFETIGALVQVYATFLEDLA